MLYAPFPGICPAPKALADQDQPGHGLNIKTPVGSVARGLLKTDGVSSAIVFPFRIRPDLEVVPVTSCTALLCCVPLQSRASATAQADNQFSVRPLLHLQCRKPLIVVHDVTVTYCRS